MQKNDYFQAATRMLLAIAAMIFTQNILAEGNISLATASHNVLEPLGFFTKAVYNICYILAIMLFVGSVASYRTYRLNPKQVTISRPIVLLILSIVTALVPILAKLSESSIYVS
jgi:hypothetical protein